MELSMTRMGHASESNPVFCPCCGQPLDVQVQIFDYDTIHRTFHLYTCWNEDCAVFGRTCSRRDLVDPRVLAQWRATHRFDVNSGQMMVKE